MKSLRFILLPLLLLLAHTAWSQEKMRLAGYVEMPGIPLTDYYLEITVQNGKVSGFSITNYKGGSRLKASVVGNMKTASELYIEETQNLDDKGERSRDYCYFKANLKLSVYRTSRRWTGPFESKQTDGFSCGNGIMTIMENAPPLDAPAPIKGNSPAPTKIRVQQEPPVTAAPKPKPIAIPKDTLVSAPKPAPPKPEQPKPKPVVAAQPVEVKRPALLMKVDTNNCLRSLEWTSDSLRLEIWDGFMPDGDVVSVYWGGQLILDHKKLGTDKLSFHLPVKSGVNILDIQMFDEGTDPPNTPDITLYDGARNVPLRVSGSYGDKARVCVERAR
jgi:hypothetical protein